MTKQDAIETIRKAIAHVEWEYPMDYAVAFDMAVSALQEQDSRTKRCATCKHNPPSKKWPCVDCDMRESADRWEPKEAKDSTKGSEELKQEVNNSTESSLTHKVLDKDNGDLQPTCNQLTTDTISRRKAIALADNLTKRYLSNNEWITDALIEHNEAIWEYQTALSMLPPAQPEPSIPISWIEKQIDWLKSMDNEFSNLTAMNISALVKKWRKENEKDKQSD
jgi:hypothetical protein